MIKFIFVFVIVYLCAGMATEIYAGSDDFYEENFGRAKSIVSVLVFLLWPIIFLTAIFGLILLFVDYLYYKLNYKLKKNIK